MSSMTSISKQDELLDLRNFNTSCHMINGNQIPREELIASGILFLNEFQVNITVDNNMRIMNGTDIVNFKNSMIVVNEKIYKNFEAPPAAIAQPKTIEKEELDSYR